MPKQDLLQIFPVFPSVDDTAQKFQSPWFCSAPATDSYAALDHFSLLFCRKWQGPLWRQYTESPGLWGLDLLNVLLTKPDLLSYGFEETRALYSLTT